MGDAAALGFDSMQPMALENNAWAGKTNAMTCGEFRPVVFLIRVDRVWSNWARPECCDMILFSAVSKSSFGRGWPKENGREPDLEAHTIHVRFHAIEFSFQKDVERQR